MNDVIKRVERMEQCFDILQDAAIGKDAELWEDDFLKELLCQLLQYYESGQWMHDYELDEQGMLPPDLKRGVLSQDAVFNFLERFNRENSSIYE